jgi:TetR/AcrR family transcriptional repressor of nem operon
MRYGPGHKEETRARILQAAGRVFRRLGYHAGGIDTVMEEAGRTAGAFYAHFGSKEALLAETLAPAAAEVVAVRDRAIDEISGREWVDAFLGHYLSKSHMHRMAEGCPLAALVSEIGRSGGAVKASFEAVVRGLAAQLQAQSGPGASEDRTLAIVALCVGGLSVARSVQDEAFAGQILSACRDLAKIGIDTPSPPAKKARKKRAAK